MRYVQKHLKKIILLTMIIGIALIFLLKAENRNTVIRLVNDGKQLIFGGDLNISINKQDTVVTDTKSLEVQQHDNVLKDENQSSIANQEDGTDNSEKNIIVSDKVVVNELYTSRKQSPTKNLFVGKYYSEQNECVEDTQDYIDKNISETGYAYLNHKVRGNINANIHQLIIDPKMADIKLVLGNDLLFGKESLSSIAGRYEADCAVNAGFSFENGRPAGMVALDDRLLTNSTGEFPVLLINEQGVKLTSAAPEKVFVYSDNKKFLISGINVENPEKGAYVYTPIFGKEHITAKSNIIVEVVDNRVSKIYKAEKEKNICQIPKNGFIIAYVESDIEIVNSIFSINSYVFVDKLVMQEESTSVAYECGSWLVKEGENVATEIDPWLGSLNLVEAKTIVGTIEENKLMFIIIEELKQGKENTQREIMSTNELFAYLNEKSIVNAALLNGGEHSQMIVDSKKVNERNVDKEIPLAAAFVINAKNENDIN